ncbi:unnamed protein product [Closterium sp. Naga37s-1]|nr:unnamed protein product [Closterium sp. Naga37s-1]
MRSTPLRFVALAILLAFSLLLTGEFEMQRRFDPQRPFRAQRLLFLLHPTHRMHTAADGDASRATNDATSRSNPHQGDESEQETEDPTPAVAAPPLSAEDFKTLESLIEQPVEEEDGQENEEEGEKGGEEEEGEDQEKEKGKVGWGWVGRLVGFGSQLANAMWERVGGVVRGGVEVWEKREKAARSRKEWRRVVESDRRKRMEARRRGAAVAGVDDCLNELQRVTEMDGLRPDALLPRNFSVHLLTLDPSRRRTGLPLRLHEWQAESVFVIGTGEPGKGRRETLLVWHSSRAPISSSFLLFPTLLVSPSLFPPPPLLISSASPPLSVPHLSPVPVTPHLCPTCALWQNLDRRFRAAGLQYTQVVMPMALEEPFKARYDPVFPARSLALRSTFHPHDLAYAFAHFEVWARVVVLRLPYALVFEDDARNEVDSNAAWKQRMEGLLRQLNLLIIQNGNRFFFDVLLLARSALAPYSEQQLTANILKAQPSMGSHAYLITYAGAKKMLARMRLNVPISEAFFTVPHAHILAADPPLFNSQMFMCRPKPCRVPPLDLHSSSRLSSACRETLFLSFPGHPRIRGNIVRKDWVPGLRPPATVRVLMRSMPPKLAMWPTFVIGLAEDADRFVSLEPVLQQQGFGEIVKANGISVSNTDYQVVTHLVDKEHRARTRTTPWWQEKQARPTLSKGEVGCALSHYFVWLEVVRRQLPYAIIFEDDVRFLTHSFKEVFERDVAEANEVITREINPFRPDIVFLGKSGIMTSFYYPKLSQHVVVSPLVWCSFAYIVSLEGARKLVERFFVNDPVDSYWWQVPGMQFWAFEPSLADHLTVKRKKRGKGVQFVSRVQGTDSEW